MVLQDQLPLMVVTGVWIYTKLDIGLKKEVSGTESHNLFDTVRGDNKYV